MQGGGRRARDCRRTAAITAHRPAAHPESKGKKKCDRVNCGPDLLDDALQVLLCDGHCRMHDDIAGGVQEQGGLGVAKCVVETLCDNPKDVSAACVFSDAEREQ